MSDSSPVANVVGQESTFAPSVGHETEEIRPCVRSLYCKVLICASAVVSFGLFMYFLIRCLESNTHKEENYSSVAAGISIALSIVLSGIVICYRRREIDVCWLFTEFFRRHLESVGNNPYRAVNFEDAGGQNERELENAENQITRETGAENNDKNAENVKNGACKLPTDTSGAAERLHNSSNSSAAYKVSEVASSVSLIASAAVASYEAAVLKISESTKPKVPPTTGSKFDESRSAVAPSKSPVKVMEEDRNQQPVIFICGDCQGENELSFKEAIRCRECGGRVLYKKRARRFVVLDAR